MNVYSNNEGILVTWCARRMKEEGNKRRIKEEGNKKEVLGSPLLQQKW
jgi:hypothetical protein